MITGSASRMMNNRELIAPVGYGFPLGRICERGYTIEQFMV